MSKTNARRAGWGTPVRTTHEGGPAARITPEQELSRLMAACLLWEDNFYESGASIAVRIKDLVPKCRPEFVAAVAYEARTRQKLRHAPLFLVSVMAGTKGHKDVVGKLLPDVIQRADELAEFVAIHAEVNGVSPAAVKPVLSKQIKKGLAAAFPKFNEYQLAKYNRDGPVKLRDVLFLAHPKPPTKEHEALWKKLVEDKLETPDTWEVALSAGGDKADVFMRLMAEKKLGAMAFLRNLRNMEQSKINVKEVIEYSNVVDIERVLPFRFLAAARAVPTWEHIIEPMMFRAIKDRPKMAGKTRVLVDVSGSMSSPVSLKSDITRLDAACGVAILLRELCDEVEVFAFHTKVEPIATRRGFALRDAIGQPRGGTHLGEAVTLMNTGTYDRLVVLTDEQSADRVPGPKGKGYMINVAAHKNGVGYGPWTHIDGWSEAVIDYVQAVEAL